MNKFYEIDETNHLLFDEVPWFDFSNPPIDPIEFADVMAESLTRAGGLGLAANQLGLPYRCCIIKSNPMLVMFNPTIVNYSDDTSLMDEGCLSYPDVVIRIKRSNTIRLRYHAPNGEVDTLKFEGLTARIIQHEVDHLNGLTFLDRASIVQKNKAKSIRKKLKRSEKVKV